MSDLMDYEAHNAKVALDLNKAQQEIARLTALAQTMLDSENDSVTWRRFRIDEQDKTIERLRGALEKIANTPPVHPLASGCAAIARQALKENEDE